MDRRSFMHACSASAACAGAGALTQMPALAADARPRSHPRALLTDESGKPLRASSLRPLRNYVFHYPFVATPAFLLDLGKPAPAQTVTGAGGGYPWPGGVGARRSIVAFSAICSHQLVYPTKDVSFISFRKSKAGKGLQDELIHCCADHSQYDPHQGAKVLAGPAPQPLAAILLQHDPATDSLTAHGTLGGVMFDAFFRKYEMKLSLDVGATARNAVGGQTVVRELERFCRNTIQC